MAFALIRRLILCLLLAAIPVQGMAAAAMLYCCDRADAGEATRAQGVSGDHGHHATADDALDEGLHHGAQAGHHDGAAHDDRSPPVKCSVCAAFCSGGVIVASAGGFSAPLSCSSPRAAAPATHFSSFFPDLAERPPLALL